MSKLVERRTFLGKVWAAGAGLVAAAGTLNDRNLVVRRTVGAVNDAVLGYVRQQVRIGESKALEHLRHEVFRLVHELVHRDIPLRDCLVS